MIDVDLLGMPIPFGEENNIVQSLNTKTFKKLLAKTF